MPPYCATCMGGLWHPHHVSLSHESWWPLPSHSSLPGFSRERKTAPEPQDSLSQIWLQSSRPRLSASFRVQLLKPVLGDRELLCSRKGILRSSQLCSTSLYPRTASQEILSNNYLNSLKFDLTNFRVLTQLFARPTFLKITNSTRA